MSAFAGNGSKFDGFQIAPLPRPHLSDVKSEAAPMEPPSIVATTQLDTRDLVNAVQELGASLRKERTITAEVKDQLNEERAKNERRIREIEAEHRHKVEELQMKISASHQQQEQLKQYSAKLQEFAKQLQAKTSEAVRQAEEARQQQHRTRLELAEKSQKSQFEIDLLKSGREYGVRHIERLERDVATLQQQLRQVREAGDDQHRRSLEREARLGSELQALTERNRALTAQATSLATEIQHQKAFILEAENARRQIVALGAEREELIRRLQREQSELQKVKHKRDDLEAQLESERSEKHMLMDCLKKSENQISDLEARLQESTRKARLLQEENARLERQAQDFAEKAAQSAAQIAKEAQEAREAKELAEKTEAITETLRDRLQHSARELCEARAQAAEATEAAKATMAELMRTQSLDIASCKLGTTDSMSLEEAKALASKMVVGYPDISGI